MAAARGTREKGGGENCHGRAEQMRFGKGRKKKGSGKKVDRKRYRVTLSRKGRVLITERIYDPPADLLIFPFPPGTDVLVPSLSSAKLRSLILVRLDVDGTCNQSSVLRGTSRSIVNSGKIDRCAVPV